MKTILLYNITKKKIFKNSLKYLNIMKAILERIEDSVDNFIEATFT